MGLTGWKNRIHGVHMSLGKTIRKARLAKGWRGEDLAAAIGITKAQVSDIENDKHKNGPAPELIVRIAQALAADNILLFYLQTNPVYKAVLPRIFPDLNNVRREPAIIFGRLAREAEEGKSACEVLAEMFSNSDLSRVPNFDATFRSQMEQVVDMKRGVELLEFQLMSAGIVDQRWLREVYEAQQRKCEERGHHIPGEEA